MEHSISLQDAIRMTTRFREAREKVLTGEFQGKNILCTSETFSREAIESLFRQPDCVKFRIYYGMDEEMKVHAILVGVNSKDVDILTVSGSTSNTSSKTMLRSTAVSTITSDAGATVEDGSQEEAILLENALRCPTNCPPPSLLNP